MTVEKLTNILDSLLTLPAETEVVEFKRAERNFDDRDLGHISRHWATKPIWRAGLAHGWSSVWRTIRTRLSEANTRIAVRHSMRLRKRMPIRLRADIRSSKYTSCGIRTAKELWCSRYRLLRREFRSIIRAIITVVTENPCRRWAWKKSKESEIKFACSISNYWTVFSCAG